MASTSTESDDQNQKKIITMRTEDGEIFEVEEAVAMQSQTIYHIVEDGCADSIVPLPNVHSSILPKIIEYCKMHHQEKDEAKLKEFVPKFMEMDESVLFELILAANYLNIKGLLDACCQKAADMIKGQTPEEIRRIFNIKNDFTPEEEAELRRENQWAFE